MKNNIDINQLKGEIFNISDSDAFEKVALQVFKYQVEQVDVYKRYCEGIGVDVNEVNRLDRLPFLPVELYKSHMVSDGLLAEEVFLSSGTTGMQQSKHYVHDANLYDQAYLKGFEYAYGHPSKYAFLALLPSYLEREGSSLITMVKGLMHASGRPENNFYLRNTHDLIEQIQKLEAAKQPYILLGVTYALLDLIESHQFNLKYGIVMETGGMKGRRKEMVKEELHQILKGGFGVKGIHSEYGMTEMLSQGYSFGEGLFFTPPWVKILLRDATDPLSLAPKGQGGGINVIDLANLHSCSFIATQDIGKPAKNDQFLVQGRFDNSDVRGCNLLVQ